jgi:hypothetical protein
LLPGTWLDRKLNVDNLSILLPLNPILKDYFGSQDLETNVQLDACNTADGPGVRITLGLKLSGFNQPLNYQVYKDFPLKAENEITQAFPTLALWPNVPPSNWREYFVFIEASEGFGGLAFSIEQPTDKATQETRQSGQEKYRYWKCDRYPEILSAIDKDAKFLGLLPLSIPQIQVGNAGTWTVGIDFGTSFTNIYVRKGINQPERFNLHPHLLRITRGLEEIETVTYREFFIPHIFLPEGNNPPLSSILTTRSWQEEETQIPNLINHARIYVPGMDGFALNQDHIKTNIKWGQISYQRPFLAQLLRLVATQAALDDVKTMNWEVSYPSAFSQKELNSYERTWQDLLKDLSVISGQTHRIGGKSYSKGVESKGLETDSPINNGLRTESIVFAQFFADILKKDLVHTTCVDVGGGTSDISVWQEEELIHQASVPYAGRDMFHRILQPNLGFLGDIFGLSSQEAQRVSQKLSDVNNFNSALDLYLRGNADKILAEGYRINADKSRNREFRTLVAVALGGLYHYLGAIQVYLVREGKMIQIDNTNNCITSILIGGNGARFLNWLSPSGCYTATSEINALLQEVLTRSSGFSANPDLMTVSTKYKEEACGGLAVLPGETRLKGLDKKQKDYPFWGETCTINGKIFTAEQRLELEESWEKIDEFRINSFYELERYIDNFNAIIADESIEEIDPLRNFGQGGLFKMTDNLKILLQRSVTKACLRKKGSVAEFEPEPSFLLTLRCFVGVLADQWSKTTN